MQLKITDPLSIKAQDGKQLELLPVRMDIGFPSRDNKLWLRFQKSHHAAGTRRHEVSDDDSDRIQAYMRRHGTEALSDDGEVAFTLAAGWLIECSPEVCMG